MSWIKIQTTIHDAPAVLAIAERTKLNEYHVVGCLVAIWSWADNLTADGHIDHATAAQIDRKAMKKGFADAMCAVGWLQIDESGVTFPGWSSHNGESAKARAETNRRVTKHRELARSGNAESVTSCNAKSVTDTVTKALPDKIREDKIRGENTNTPLPPAGGMGEGVAVLTHFPIPQATPRICYPGALNEPRFIAVFEREWLPHLAERNRRMPSNITVDKQLAQLSEHRDPIAAIECLQEAMRLGFVAPLKHRPKHAEKPPAPAPIMNAREYAI